MSHDPLDDALAAHYAARGPDPAALDRLRKAVRTAEATPRLRLRAGTAFGPGWAPTALATAGVLAAACVLVVVTLPLVRGHTPAEEAFAALVPAEIALNHEKQLDSEWATGDLGVLAGHMPKLDFVPRWPEELPATWSLAGGRYCSVGGRIAAQLHLRDAAGRAATLYAFRNSDAFSGLATGARRIDGTSVRLWREGGLVFGLAETAEGA